MDELIAFCDELGKDISETKKYSKMLKQAVLQEAFGGK